jgi:hypothetical protein
VVEIFVKRPAIGRKLVDRKPRHRRPAMGCEE